MDVVEMKGKIDRLVNQSYMLLKVRHNWRNNKNMTIVQLTLNHHLVNLQGHIAAHQAVNINVQHFLPAATSTSYLQKHNHRTTTFKINRVFTENPL